MTVVDPVDGETLWSHELAEKGQDALACREPQVQARARVAMLVCSWDLTDYATGQEQYASTVHTFDARTGAALRTVTARRGSVIWTDVAADGRVLVGRTDVDDGWMIDAVTARGEHSTVSLGVDPTGTHSSMRLLTVFDDQVLVVDAGSEILRSLR